MKRPLHPIVALMALYDRIPDRIPRNISKSYKPHQGEKEKARRIRQGRAPFQYDKEAEFGSEIVNSGRPILPADYYFGA